MTEEKREKALEEAREQLTSEVERDRFLVKAVKQLELVEKNLDGEMERFRDWYSLHFPELVEEIDGKKELLSVLSRGVNRRELDSFSSMAESSKGKELAQEEIQVLEKTVGKLESDASYREELEKYVEKAAGQEMPNLSALLGPVLATKLMAFTGSLEKLAKSPASTIQMLGAEKALFRHLRGEGEPPKHGILFEHRFVSGLPEGKRGKMARFLANKAAIAARLDQYGEKQKGDKLREEAREKFEELEEK